MSRVVAGKSVKHKHIDPDYDRPAVSSSQVRWNTVAVSSCGHYFVRRHSLGWMIPLPSDHYPQWVRLRPWHVVACLKLSWKWVTGQV